MSNNENENLDNKSSVAPAGSIDTENLPTEQKDNFDEAKKEARKTQAEVKESSDTLQGIVVDSATVKLDAKSSTYINQQETQSTIDLETYEGYTRVLKYLIKEIDLNIAIANKNKGRVNKSGQQTLDTAIKKLNQYREIIKGKQKSIEDEFNMRNRFNRKNPDIYHSEVNISKAEIDELKNTRFRRKQQIEYDIKQGQSGKSSNTAPWPNQSIEQIKKGNRVEKDHIKYNMKLNEALQDTTFLHAIDNNQNIAREILQGIANNSLSDSQIIIIQANMNQLSHYFEQYGMRDQVHRCIQTRGGRYSENYNIYGNIDNKTAYKTGGIVGLTNNLLIKAFPNAKPEQVSNFTNVAVAAGGIYAIYRIGKRFFGKNKEGKRNLLGKTALLVGGGYFLPQLLLGQDGYSLLGDMLTGKADFSELWYRTSNCLRFMKHNDPEVYSQMAPGILGMSLFPQKYTVSEVRTLQQSFSDENTRKQRYLATYNRLNKHNSALASEFKNTFTENQYNENEWKVFLAKLGITDKTSGDTVVFNEASKTADKKTSFELWMKSQGKEKNPEFKKEIDNYLKQDGEFNPTSLNPDWFKDNNEAKYTMREIDFTNIKKLNNKVDNLPLDNQQKSVLKTALEEFYDERTIASKPNPNDFDLKMENGLLILKSHGGHESKINLETKALEGFGPGITFSSLSDLLHTADLTNQILETQKGKIAVGKPIFEYKPERKGICFNDASSLRQDIITRNNTGLDTRVLSTARHWKILLQSNENIMCNHPKEYAQYLSNRWVGENTLEISKYLIIDDLSKKTGITFTNEKEAQEVEARLKEIKDGKKFSIGDLGGKPFEVRWKWFDKKLGFINVDKTEEIFPEDISEKFPTIILNKDKFLAYMNDQSNGMRGSEITKKLNS